MNKQELIKELGEEGFSDKIISAFYKVKRENFIPNELKSSAYENIPLPIGNGQTISQPYTIAFMLNLLEFDKLQDNKKAKILEVGSGCGYGLSLLSEVCSDCNIYGIERIKELADKSRKALKNNRNIKIFNGDGSIGLEREKPFDRIIVSASADKIPDALISQLNDKGILVIPIRDSIIQLKKKGKNIIKKEYPGFIFVPLISDQ